MSEWETLREAAEIMEREGYPGAGNARRLSAQLQAQAGQDERDEELAKALYDVSRKHSPLPVPEWGYSTGPRVKYLEMARAAREHISAEGFAPGGHVTRPGDPEPLTVEPPVGSVVRDYEGVRWTRVDAGWIRDCKVSPWLWETVRELLGPLTLVSTPEETA